MTASLPSHVVRRDLRGQRGRRDWRVSGATLARHRRGNVPGHPAASFRRLPEPVRAFPGSRAGRRTGNSGSQIAEELFRAGRTVYLSVGYSGFPLAPVPREGHVLVVPQGEADTSSGSKAGACAALAIPPVAVAAGRSIFVDFPSDGIHLLGRIQAIDGHRRFAGGRSGRKPGCHRSADRQIPDRGRRVYRDKRTGCSAG